MQEPLEVEVVPESIRINTEPIDGSIRDKWMGATEAYKRCNLSKSSFQRAVSHLIGIRGCRVESVRRGDAKNTRYSELAIELIKACKAGDEPLVQQLLELTKPVTKCSALAAPNHVGTLEEKIARLKETSASNSEAIGDRIRGKLAQIATCNQQATQRSETLNSAELLAAENRGIEQALAIFSAEEEAKENALAHLRALKISSNQ